MICKEKKAQNICMRRLSILKQLICSTLNNYSFAKSTLHVCQVHIHFTNSPSSLCKVEKFTLPNPQVHISKLPTPLYCLGLPGCALSCPHFEVFLGCSLPEISMDEFKFEG